MTESNAYLGLDVQSNLIVAVVAVGGAWKIRHLLRGRPRVALIPSGLGSERIESAASVVAEPLADGVGGYTGTTGSGNLMALCRGMGCSRGESRT